jgi:hypothetical protein
VAVATTHVAALAHSAARESVDAGSLIEARDALATAVTLDPSMALYRREYGIVLATIGDGPRAEEELRHASSLNPADTTALRGLALLSSTADRERYAIRAASVQPLYTENWLAVAMSGTDPTNGLSDALRIGPWLSGSERWGELYPVGGELTAILEVAALRAAEDPVPRGSMSRAWHEGVQGQGSAVSTGPAGRALAALLRCDLRRASELYSEIGRDWSDSPAGIVGRLMLAQLAHEDATRLLRIAALRNPVLGAAARGTVASYSLLADPITDALLYRRLGLGRGTPGPVVSRSTDALGAWMTDPVGAAQRGAPDAGLATCQPP